MHRRTFLKAVAAVMVVGMKPFKRHKTVAKHSGVVAIDKPRVWMSYGDAGRELEVIRLGGTNTFKAVA